MKRSILLLIACFCLSSAHAAYLKDVPMTLTQPDGTVMHCYASGDEYFNYLHDANGFTIMQHPQTGFWVYADKQDGKLVATEYVAGKVDPANKNLQPYNLISPQEWAARRDAWKEKEKQLINRDDPNHGTLNNIGVFIRFSDDGQFSNTYSSIDNMFNDESTNAVSLKTYFRAASYNAIEIPTYFYPGHSGETIISYQDTYPKSYFQPYNASTNPNGYNGDDEREEREFSLLERAVNYINSYYPVPSSLNIDYNNDGYVDNICFIVKGDVGAWSSLLWPHQWSIYSRAVYLNGKRVGTFNFQLADATGYFNTSTMCHEMNHSLGAPDLYHYSYEGPDAVGIWDLMHNNTMPPQHCGAYMKMKYGHWIDEIPEITQPGVYTLKPISSSTPTNIAYKIASSDPDQYYIVEYRDNTSLFETGLPGSGLLVYRIDTRFEGMGNRYYDPDNGYYDEVYIFRPGGSFSDEGNLNSAYFSSNAGRTEFSASTSAYPFFSDGTIDENFRIYNITSAGSTISFSYDNTGVMPEGHYIGDGSTETSMYLPSYSYYNYTLSQQIYTSNELGNAGYITSMAFFNDGAEKTRTYDFYLKHTTKDSFENESDWITVAASDLVFSGTVTMAASDWTVINFDTPFTYDGVSNLVLVTDDNTGSYTTSPHMACRVFNAPSQALRRYSDGTDYNPFTPSSYSGTMMNVKNQLLLNKQDIPIQVFADYHPDMDNPTSPYVRVHWGTDINLVEDFERGDFSLFAWQNDPAYPWEITSTHPYDGAYCIRPTNHNIANSTSSIEVTVNVPADGIMSFYGYISSENSWDYGRFYIDDVQQGIYTGAGNSWTKNEFSITQGIHNFKWSYEKDSSVNSNEDYFYVDHITFYQDPEPAQTRSVPHYRVYRANCDGSGMQLIADDVTENQYIDTEWTDLALGSYKYGVCTISNEFRDDNRSGNRSTWDLHSSYSCTSAYQYGIVTDGVNIYHSAWSSSAGFKFAKYDMDGNFIESFDVDGCGYLRDMSYDGQYFYGSDVSSTLYCVDLVNKQLISTTNTECDAIRYCAYDPVRDGFWVGNWSTNIQCISRTGTTLVTGPYGNSFSGAAYYKDDNNVEHVYMFAQPFSNAVIYDYDISSNTISSEPVFSVTYNVSDATGTSGGCCIDMVFGKIVLFADVQQQPNLVCVFELKDEQIAWSNCIEKSNVQQTIALSAGSNWTSFNIEITLDDLKAALLEAVPNTEITIQGQNNNVKYNPNNNRWTGRLTLLDLSNMYKISVSSDCEITLEGAPVNPAEHPVTISYGSNWIAFPLNTSMSPTDAFAGFAQSGDKIQSQINNASYNGARWNGRMTSLDPGQGYIYQSGQSGDRTLVFPTSAK